MFTVEAAGDVIGWHRYYSTDDITAETNDVAEITAIILCIL